MMTTVIYKEAHVVSDSMESDEGNRLKLSCYKIFIGNGFIIGTAGHSSGGILFTEWYRNSGAEKDKIAGKIKDLSKDEDFLCMVITPQGIIQTTDKFPEYVFQYVKIETYDRFLTNLLPHTQEYYAIGSGSKIAFPVLDLGYSAYEAMEMACKYDMYTGGNIISVPVTECLHQDKINKWADPKLYTILKKP